MPRALSPLQAPNPPRAIYGGYREARLRQYPESLVAITAANGAYGAYVQLTAGLSYDVLITEVVLQTTGTAQTDTYFQWALGAGASGSEVIISEFKGGRSTAASAALSSGGLSLPFPVFVPAGTRLAVKVACGGTAPSSNTIEFYFIAAPVMKSIATHVVAPVGKGSSAGATARVGYYPLENLAAGIVPSAGTYPTFGAWSVLGSQVPVASFLTHITIGGSTNSVSSALEIGLGAAGSEIPLAGIHAQGNSSSNARLHSPIWLPAGARLSVRGMNNAAFNMQGEELILVPESAVIPIENLGLSGVGAYV